MKKTVRFIFVFFLCNVALLPEAQAYLTVNGNGTAPGTPNGTTLNTGVAVGAFFKPTGEVYFGLQDGGGAYSICYGNFRTPDTATSLLPLGSHPTLNNKYINEMHVVTNSLDQSSPTIAMAVVANNAATGTAQLFQAISKTNTSPVASPLLGDTTGATTSGIRNSNSTNTTLGANVIFAPVKVTGGVANTVPFGAGAAGTSGAKTDGLIAGYITQTNGIPAWSYVGANGTNRAQPFDLTSTGSFLIPDAGPTPITNVNPNAHSLIFYDPLFQRLYIGLEATVADGGVGVVNGIYGVGIYPVTITGTTVTIGTQLLPCGTPNTALHPDMANVVSPAGSIIGYSQTHAATGTYINNLKTMHTSTGMGYLIVQGNTLASGAATSVIQSAYNNIYAVPLVNGTPDATNAVGCFANVNSGDRTTRAQFAGDLVTTASLAALVGGTGILPVTNALLGGQPSPNAVSLIGIDGDTVCVATGGSNSASSINEPGFWISQAIFNNLGQIDHWTDWRKIAPNDMGGNSANGVPSDGSDPRVDFAVIDGYTGHFGTFNALNLKAQTSQWTKPITTTPNSQQYLAAAVNNALNDQCYSVLDMNLSVTGWGASNPTQLTLFGGNEAVCFAITGSRGAQTSAVAPVPEVNGTYTTINTSMADSVFDYTSTQTFVISQLPAGAGAVMALGFSGWNADTLTGTNVGFFLAGCAGTAGTAPGLYVYSPAGTAGFNPISVGTTKNIMIDLGLTSATAGTAPAGIWKKLNNISGMPIKIQGMGGGLHILTRTATLDRIYSCPKQATVAGLNTNFVVTASSGVAPIPGSPASSLVTVAQIYDFVVSVSATPQGTTPATGNEQLMMLTNDGIYTSSSLIGMQSYLGNLNQLTAGWILIDQTSALLTRGFFSNYIAVPEYNRLPQTCWFANYAPNSTLRNVFNMNTQYQLSRQSFNVAPFGGGPAVPTLNPNALTYTELPSTNFNGSTVMVPTATTNYPNFPVLARLFYNDGIRRYFVQKSATDDTKYQLLVLPYNLYDYNIPAGGKAPMTDAVIVQANAFYWMSMIGDTGRLMMGTSNGVLSLQ